MPEVVIAFFVFFLDSRPGHGVRPGFVAVILLDGAIESGQVDILSMWNLA